MTDLLSRAACGLVRAIERRPGRVILALTLAAVSLNLWALGLRGHRPRIVRGDAVHYYVYVRSLVFDHDLDFDNDYRALYSLDFVVEPPPPGFTWNFGRTPTGRVRNYMAIGTPLVWMPVYLCVTGGVAAWDLAGGHYPADGYGLLFQLVPTVAGALAGGLGLWFAFLLCGEFASRRAAIFGTLTACLGTSFVYYLLVAPGYSHAVSACVASAFFLYWWRSRDDMTVWRFVRVGALGGMLALVRWQDALALSVVLGDVVCQARQQPAPRTRLRFAAGRLAAAGLAALVVFTPQLLAWQALYGQLFTIPQGGDFMRWTAPAIVAVLFSPYRGLIAWTPLAAAGLLGLVPMWNRSRRLAVAAGVFVVAGIYVNASVADWWAGEAFGARRFLSCFPIFALGTTLLVAGSGPWRVAARVTAGLLVAANLLLLVHYETFMLGHRSLAAYPDNWWTLWVERFITPVTLLRAIF
jgi:hypothetical protein